MKKRERRGEGRRREGRERPGREKEENGRRRGEDKGTNKTLLATVYYARASEACYESPTIVGYFSLE